MTQETATRRYELDWIRVGAILIVFIYHSTRFFDLGDWHVKNADTYTWVSIWQTFAVSWMMPLFFFISGASLFYAIGKSGGFRPFYVGKFQRLMIPVLVGCVTTGMLQVYLERFTHGQFSGSLFAFIPNYFQGLYLATGMPGNFAFHGMHLWYLFFLFLYGLVCYRLFIWVRERQPRVPDWFFASLTVPGLAYVWFALPLLVMKLTIPGEILDVGSGGWGFLFYLWFLIAGFLVMSSERMQQHLEDQRWVSFCLGVALSITQLWAVYGFPEKALDGGSVSWIGDLCKGVSSWCWVFAILGFGMRHLTFDHRWLGRANEGVLPFYILHQTVLLAMGYYIMNWEIHDALKWAIVTPSAFAAIILFYELPIRRLELFRFLFGMKSSHPCANAMQRTGPLTTLHLLYAGLFVIAL